MDSGIEKHNNLIRFLGSGSVLDSRDLVFGDEDLIPKSKRSKSCKSAKSIREVFECVITNHFYRYNDKVREQKKKRLLKNYGRFRLAKHKLIVRKRNVLYVPLDGSVSEMGYENLYLFFYYCLLSHLRKHHPTFRFLESDIWGRFRIAMDVVDVCGSFKNEKKVVAVISYLQPKTVLEGIENRGVVEGYFDTVLQYHLYEERYGLVREDKRFGQQNVGEAHYRIERGNSSETIKLIIDRGSRLTDRELYYHYKQWWKGYYSNPKNKIKLEFPPFELWKDAKHPFPSIDDYLTQQPKEGKFLGNGRWMDQKEAHQRWFNEIDFIRQYERFLQNVQKGWFNDNVFTVTERLSFEELSDFFKSTENNGISTYN